MTWAFVQYAGLDGDHSFWKYATTWKIWEEALKAVETGESAFELAFCALAEACVEAFATSLIQQFSFMKGMLEGHDMEILGLVKVSGEHIVVTSICLSVFFYGQGSCNIRLVWQLGDFNCHVHHPSRSPCS